MTLLIHKVPKKPEPPREPIREGKIMAELPDANERKAVIPAPTAVGAAVARGEGDYVPLAQPGTPAWADIMRDKDSDMLEVQVEAGKDFLDHNGIMRRGSRPDAEPDKFFAPHRYAHEWVGAKLVKILQLAPEGTLPGSTATAAPSTRAESLTGALETSGQPENAATEGGGALKESAEKKGSPAKSKK